MGIGEASFIYLHILYESEKVHDLPTRITTSMVVQKCASHSCFEKIDFIYLLQTRHLIYS
jgi:hypothetical protein